MASTSRVAIVTDSTADLPLELRTQMDITMVPLNVHIDGETFRDQIDISNEEFMHRLATSADLPSTSPPDPSPFQQAFRNLAESERFDGIVCVLTSSRLSGTVVSAQIAADAVRNVINVEVVDSLNGSLGCGYQVLNAQQLATRGLSATEIAAELRTQIDRFHVIFFVEALRHTQRGGGVGKAASLVGSALRLKPLLRIDEGQVVPFERARTREKAIDVLVEFAENLPDIKRITAMHNTSPQEAASLFERVRSLASQDPEMRVATFGPALSTHVGPGTLGLAIEVASRE